MKVKNNEWRVAHGLRKCDALIPVFDYDRFLMGFSLGVHIILAVIGIALPVIIVAAEVIGLKRKDQYYTRLAKKLTIMLIIFFAIGTASGTLVALELLLLWPKFMVLVSSVAILTLYIEVFAFFLEAIFLGIYAYSWNKFKNGYMHALTGCFVALGAVLSAVFITMLNAFMNTPKGFNIQEYIKTGIIADVHPLAALATPSTLIEVAHVVSTSYFAGGMIFVLYFAYRMLRSSGDERLHYKKGLNVAFSLVIIATFFSVITGILSISGLYAFQPEKYAALELDLVPQTHAPELLGGFYLNGRIIDAISVPNLQSILATGSANGAVPGLSEFPASTWPPLIVHFMFDTIVGLGFGFGLFIIIILLLAILKKKPFEHRIVLVLLIIAAVVGIFLLELGWATAEIGRQPWIIYNVMLVSQAANTSPSVIPIAIFFIIFYIAVLPFTVMVIKRVFKNRPIANM
ncbi:cytochrome ubiquinol oxidase subunit I [Candidatus Marsarchaeota archaeon]|nr:cytochrome ubiquinol oxidase subunit I [Candidatus Marsarchaeota archaeon]MCL5404674.1 cytochrome ubiquinol oxidase subunit I [Candidatus Marsarchaeota archaeon]